MTPEFVKAWRPIVRWARANGWYADGWGGWRNDTARFRVLFDDYGPADSWIAVRTWTNPRNPCDRGTFRVDSAQQVVDVLCALDVLPARFSSQWRAGGGTAAE